MPALYLYPQQIPFVTYSEELLLRHPPSDKYVPFRGCYLLSSDHLLFFCAAQTVVSQRYRRFFLPCRQYNRNPTVHQRVYIIKRIVIRKTVALNYPTPFKCRDYSRAICETRFYSLRSRSLCILYKFAIIYSVYCLFYILPYCNLGIILSITFERDVKLCDTLFLWIAEKHGFYNLATNARKKEK